MTSVDSIVAILRHYRTQCPLSRCPIVLIYGAIMAGTALSFARQSNTGESANTTEKGNCHQETELEHRVKTIIKLLEEVSQIYPPAFEASIRLKTYFGIASRQPQKQQMNKVLDKNQDPNDSSKVQDSPTSRPNPGDTLDDQHWSQDPMALLSSMDAGILNLMPTDWPDMANDESSYLWDTGEQTNSIV